MDHRKCGDVVFIRCDFRNETQYRNNCFKSTEKNT